ncbi:MAG: SDR family oxidoreductase [Actinomycetota bacterium]|nr:SDR family oxidoreductase [Actinomycetota bacterium]
MLVTGGSMGIGLAVARELAARGGRVAIGARSIDAVEEALATLAGSGHLGLGLDVADPAQWTSAIATLDAAGPLHGLVTAAGVQGPVGMLEELAPDELKRAIDVNLIGTLLALHHALPRLRASGGRAVTLSGGGATAPLPRYDAYAASKAGVVRLTENVARASGVGVNAVAPGFVVTRMHDATIEAGPERAGAEYYERSRRLLAEGGVPASEAAELVCFLLSPEAEGITGRLISAQWDPWREEEFRQQLRADPDLATLRRIDEQFFIRRPEVRP